MNRKTYASTLGFIFLALAFLTSCNSTSFHPPAETIAATSGSPQSTAVYTAFTTQLTATVTMGSTPVSGAFVTFTAPATGASGTFATTSLNTETDITNSSGVAISSVFTANGTVGADNVTASAAGVIGSVAFNLTNTAGLPAAIAATSGSLQDADTNGAFGDPLVATVVDQYGNPVSGATVTFAAPASGASGVFASNTSNTEMDTTDTNGQATSSAFTANATVGAYAVVAVVSTRIGTTSVNFNLANITGTLISIAPTSGTPQTAPVNSAFAAPLVATVTSGGAAVSGATVKFIAPASGPGGTFANGTNTDTETTNASGVATSTTFTANGPVGTYTVTASVTDGAEPANFILTNNPLNFAFYVSGLEVGEGFYALAGSVTLDGDGNVLGGEQDYNDADFVGIQSPEPSGDIILPGSGALVVDPATGQGTLTLTTNNPNVGEGGYETLAVQFVNLNHALIVQFDGSATSSGSMDLQTLSSALNDGNYAFTLTGEDPGYYSLVLGGVFSISSGGTAVSGTFDVDDFGSSGSTPTLGTAFTGTITGPDAFGRGTIASTDLPANSLNFYVVGPEAIRIIDVDLYDSGVGSAFGQGAGTFSNTSLGSSVFGVESNAVGGSLFAAAGLFATDSTAGTFTGYADDNELDNEVIVPGASISGTYAVGGNGYGNLTITPTNSWGDVSVLGIYMTDPALNLNDPNNTTSGLGGALVADLDGFDLNGTGVLIPQTDTAKGHFTGNYAFGAQDYNYFHPSNSGYEFDFVGQGAVSGNALNKAPGLLSDPFFAFNATQPDGTDSAKFTGTATPDPSNAGRYTLELAVAVAADPVNFDTVIYQASGGLLFWLDESANGYSVSLGTFQQQGSLAGLPAVKKAAVKTQTRKKQ